MLLKNLISSAQRFLIKQGYTNSTIYVNYVRHWNRLIKDIGESEYSLDLLIGYIIKQFDRNLLELSTDEMNLKEYRCCHAYLSLNSFYEFGSIPGSSMASSAVRQVLNTASENVINLYIDYLDQKEYSSASKKYEYSIVHALLLSCPINQMKDSVVLNYLQCMGNKAKETSTDSA